MPLFLIQLKPIQPPISVAQHAANALECRQRRKATLALNKEHQITIDKTTTTELEAAAFRRLVVHLQNRTDVQNIDMMNLAGFCRNCMSRWYREAANESGIDMDETAARAIIYGMDYADWKDNFQTKATAEQKAKYNELHPHE